ncbi:hypothetical protein [Nitrosopumilus sp.]|uniref:hypothetical protein n=1 Tax=Nitrosopumilus sp. TaxID=2024843 RepID=UPI00247EC60B|nr:hypothetical protein [Nitrosopumilus sp.]MCV0431878.1 hypothetical protein [Nitrosopumilus sp.]
MNETEKLAKKISAFIEKNLKGNTPFQNTSDFLSYIAYKEIQKKSHLSNSDK